MTATEQTFKVPNAVQAAARDALELHSSRPLEDVTGIALAERLVEGTITAEDIASLRRFFLVNGKHHDCRVAEARTGVTDALCRSWDLRGAEHGRVWSERLHANLVREGVLEEDPYLTLMRARPDEVYARFRAGAWRWEYGLETPAQAARFYEHYHRATGYILDLGSAFGESAKAVSNAIYRRLHGPDPFREAAKLLTVTECAEYRLAVLTDRRELEGSAEEGVLFESMKPAIYTNPNAKLTAKMVWPSFVGYAILAAERPELLVDMNGDSMRPPTIGQNPKALQLYHDAIATYVTYFHPKGAKFVDAMGTEFEGLDAEVEDFIHRAFMGKKLIPNKVQKLLGRMRRWTAQNKLAGSLFHVYNADWKKGNWQHILDAIPQDADVRQPFAAFAKLSPLPVEGVKLQQTLNDKKALAIIAKEFNLDPKAMPKQMRLGQTSFGLAAKKLGTPIGVHSVIEDSEGEHALLACFSNFSHPESGVVGNFFVIQMANGSLGLVTSAGLRDALKAGELRVTKAHKDMQQLYAAAHAAPKKPSDVSTGSDPIKANVPPKIEATPLSDKFESDPDLAKIYLANEELFNGATDANWLDGGFQFDKRVDDEGWAPATKGSAWADKTSGGDEPYTLTFFGRLEIETPIGRIRRIVWQDGSTFVLWEDDQAADAVFDGDLWPTVHADSMAPQDDTPPSLAQQAKNYYKTIGAFETGMDFASPEDVEAEFYTAEMPLGDTVTGQSAALEKMPLAKDALWAKRTSFSKPWETVKILGAVVWGESPPDAEGHFSGENGIDIVVRVVLASGAEGAVATVADTELSTLLVQGNFKPLEAANLPEKLEGDPVPTNVAKVIEDSYPVAEMVATSARGSEFLAAVTAKSFPPPYEGQQWKEVKANVSWFYSMMVKVRLSTGKNAMIVVFKHENGSIIPFPDANAATLVKGDTLVIEGGPVAPGDTEQPNPFGFGTGDVVEYGGLNYWIGGQSGGAYSAVELRASALTQSLPATLPATSLTALVSKGNFQDPAALWPFIEAASGLTKLDTNYEAGMQVGDVLEGGTSGKVLGFLDGEGDMRVVIAEPVQHEVGGQKFDTFNLLTMPVADVGIAASSYNPPVAPENPDAADTPDPDNLELAGTQVAFNKAEALGATPVTKSDDGIFHWNLGEVLAYGNNKTRTIIGYARKDPGNAPIYLILTEKGNANWVTAAKGNSKYGPPQGWDQSVIDALLPLPNAPAPQFPDLKYKLTPETRKWLSDNSTVAINPPKGAKFYVGTPLTLGATTATLRAWIGEPGSEIALLEHSNGQFQTYGGLTGFQINYTTKTTASPLGDFEFGKAGVQKISLTNAFDSSNSIHLPSPEPEGWDDPAPLEEPAFSHLPKGKNAVAAVLCVTPAGTSFMTPVANGKTQFPSVTLVKPLGGFAGYDLSLPKGTVDKGESTIKAAVREFWEETGMTCKPVAHLGDFRGITSIVRVYVGYVTGGDPHTKKSSKEETEAVVMKPLELANGAYKSTKWFKDLVPASGTKWQQQAIEALAEWLEENGVPQGFAVKEAEDHSQVTGPNDVQPPSGVPAVSSADGESLPPVAGAALPANPDDVWKPLLFKAPFPVTTAMVTALKKQVKAGIASTPVSFNAAREREVGPKFGEVFETAVGTPYTCAGYVSWEGDDGSFEHYLLGLSGAGLVEPILVEANGAPDFTTSTSDTESSKAGKDAWFTHPDAATNARIQAVYEAGGSLSKAKVNMQTFKVKWLKEAGVPFYAVASTNMLLDISALFVPGAASEAMKDAVLGCLQARMKSTQKKKPAQAQASAPVASTQAAAPPPPSQTVKTSKPSIGGQKLVTPAKPLVSPLMLTTIQNPEMASLTPVDGKTLTASSKPTSIMIDDKGQKVFVKWRAGEPFQAETDKAAADLMAMVKGNVVPVNSFVANNGHRASVQPFFEHAKPAQSDVTALSDENMAELLSQHAFDMFVGDHDGHAGNWITVNGKLIAIDRGQAFKFVLMGKTESLDPNWHAPGNIGAGYAKGLLKQWAAGKAEIPTSAWAAFRGTIESIQNTFAKATLKAAMEPIFEALGTPAAKRTKALTQLEKRRASYLDDWTKVLTGLRSDFKWPAAKPGLKVDGKAFVTSPEALGFTDAEQTTVEQAVAAGWQGKSMRVNGPHIENQEVMVRRVLYEEKPGMKVPATLVHFRVSKPGGDKMAKAMLAKGHLEATDSAGGPQRLMADKTNGVYEKLFAAIKSINFHLNKTPDGKPNPNTIAAAVGQKALLEKILAETQDPSGTYAPTNEPNEAVNAMADQYLGYIDTVVYWNENAMDLIGQHSPQFTEFVYEEPEEDKAAKAAKAPPYKLQLKNQGASYPTITTEAGGAIVVKNLHKPVVNSSQVGQFVIEDKPAGARVFMTPTSGGQGLKAGVQGVKGMCWGIIPGEPSSSSVAHLFGLVQDATGISMKPSTKKDRQVLYLAKQVAVHQGGGSFKPDSNGTAMVDKDLKEGMAAYEAGNLDKALQILKARAAVSTGVSVKAVNEAIENDSVIDGAYDARGAGFYRHTRLGYTRDKIIKEMGPTTYVGHNLLGASSVLDFLKSAITNGALLSNEVKPFYGVTKQGASPSSDFNSGGSQGIFCGFRKVATPKGAKTKHLYFDMSLALRLDVYIVGTGDSFGNVNVQRYTTPKKWVSMGAIGTGGLGASSSHQVVVRHDIDLQQYLRIAKCASATEAAQCIEMVKKAGWTFQFGPPEKIFVA